MHCVLHPMLWFLYALVWILSFDIGMITNSITNSLFCHFHPAAKHIHLILNFSDVSQLRTSFLSICPNPPSLNFFSSHLFTYFLYSVFIFWVFFKALLASWSFHSEASSFISFLVLSLVFLMHILKCLSQEEWMKSKLYEFLCV